MKPPISKQEVLAYLRLEEDEATFVLLTAASLRYLGAFATLRGPSHFWSFPTACGLAWAELTEGGTLTMPHEVPQAVRDATPACAEHHPKTTTTRPAAAPRSLALRAKPERAVWVPARVVPAYVAHDASFDQALKYYGASAITDSRARTRAFHLQLTSGRYACIEWRRSYPQTVVIGLEVDTSCADSTTIGKVFVVDLEEILQPMGGRFKRPVRQGLIEWSEGD